MNRLKVSTRLTALVSLLALLLLVIGISGLQGLALTNQGLKTVYEERTVPATQLGAIQSALLMLRLSVTTPVAVPTPDNIEAAQAAIQQTTAQIDELWNRYAADPRSAEEQQLADTFKSAYQAFMANGLNPAMAAIAQYDLTQARQMLGQALPALYDPAKSSLNALTEWQIAAAQREYEAATERYQRLLAMTVAAIGIGLLLAGWMGWVTIRGLMTELGAEPQTASALAQEVARGNLTAPIQLRPGDQRSLMRYLKDMQTGLAHVVSGVREHASHVAAASAEIAQGNSDLSQRTERQAASLQETAASMERLTAAVHATASHAQQASQMATGACGIAERGGTVVQDVIETMKGINQSSARISDIIGVIDGIAFQTNILALNAAVEAARAGEQGRGFAVVASEVRQLAQRSAAAAREIKTLITESVTRVETGTALVDRAGDTMQDVVAAIQRVSGIVDGISQSTQEQSRSLVEVNTAITDMDRTTQQNAALVEQSAAATESLRQQADELVQVVSVFRLEQAVSHSLRLSA